MKKGTSPSALSDSFCRIPSANAVSADASAAMNSHILFRVPTKQCPGICTGRCTPHSTFLIERTKKHIILPFPPAFICFRKTWIPHFRRCSRMRMQCFTRRNRNEIRMLRKFYQNRNWFFSGKQLEYLRDDFWIRISSETDRQKRLFDQKISKKRQVNRMDSCDSHGRSTSIGREPENMQDDGHPSVLL